MATESATETAEGKRSGMASASLVLGIGSLVLFFCAAPAAILAIILGHIAHHRARRQPDKYDRAGSAIAGFVTGYAALALGTFFLLQGLGAARGHGRGDSMRE